jgi:hypothetical protein
MASNERIWLRRAEPYRLFFERTAFAAYQSYIGGSVFRQNGVFYDVQLIRQSGRLTPAQREHPAAETGV